MSDETNRAVQAPTHASTAVIYGGAMEKSAGERSVEEEGPLEDPPMSLTHHPLSPNRGATALIKPCADGPTSVSDGQRGDGGTALNSDGRLLCGDAFASK